MGRAAGVIVSVGAHHLRPRPGSSREERLARAREMLAHALTRGSTVAVVGNGCSIPLGYPSWSEFAKEIVDLALQTLEDRSQEGTGIERVRRFQERLETARHLESKELMFIIGACKRLLSCPGALDPYRQYLRDRFQPPTGDDRSEHNPHRALLDLPIYRFVTTNYDCELERALAAERGLQLRDFGISRDLQGPGSTHPLSFTQRPENPDQLALFALARVGAATNMVFHCHGRYDDPDSIVATELDYQTWYLSEKRGGPSTFLHTLDLLFESNPILFVGYGLGDEDLLRPLRRLGAASPERREFRPLFALLPEPSDGAHWDHHDWLFERYGLNVLPFVAPVSNEREQWGQALCAALKQLEEHQRWWKDGWLEKPMIRRVVVSAQPPHPYRHYNVEVDRQETLGRRRVAEELEWLKEAALAGARVIGLVGPGGTGKSWHAIQLIETLDRGGADFEGLFFWSSYYADDCITGLDRLLAYIDPRGDRKKSRLTRLRTCLAKGRYLIALDGVERLLRATDDPEVGESNDPIVRELLKIFANAETNSTLILTSRLWPRDLNPEEAGIEKRTLTRMRTDDIAGVEPFRRLPREELSALCSLLDGHTYALLLAAGWLEVTPPRDASRRLLELRRALADAPPDQRLATMIRLAIDALAEPTQALARPLLERLAVFMSPVTEQTVEICFELASGSRATGLPPGPSAREVMDQLRAAHLLFKVSSGPSELDPVAYTVHPTVRSYVFQQAQQIEHDVLPSFTLAGFTSGKAAVHPGSKAAARLVEELFDRLHQRAERELFKDRREAARQLCRSLFGIVRSRMEANTAPRWTSYNEYIRFGLQAADLTKRLSRRLWSFREPTELDKIEDAEAPLYADELAFIYNDIGLTLCAEGYMHDTLAVWEQGYDINRILEGTAEVPLYSLQSQLHLAHTLLEIGHLRVASQFLDETVRTNHKVRDPDYEGRILGYQALIAHHRNHLADAERMYGEAIDQIKAAGGNPRAESFFLSHRAKLAISLGRDNPAEEHIRASRSVAEAGEARDLVAYARTAHGRLLRETDSFARANAEYHAALAEARHLGIRRLEAEVLSGLARLALRLGDAELARRRALESLALANELSLGLRRTQTLVVLGLATVRAGQPRLGLAYLRLAKRLGDEQQYYLRSREAEEELQKFGESSESV